MGLLDSVLGAIGGAQGSPGGQGGFHPDLLNLVLGMLANNGGGQGVAVGGLGGLGDLIGRFQQSGLGDQVASWIGTGQNLPVSADQVHSALGSDAVASIAGQLGLSHGDVTQQLSQLLPHVLDRLTPQGSVPSGGLGDLGAILSQLSSR